MTETIVAVHCNHCGKSISLNNREAWMLLAVILSPEEYREFDEETGFNGGRFETDGCAQCGTLEKNKIVFKKLEIIKGLSA
ncbi:MAG TPA: hypothetical protein PK526_01300 [bacterium]|nr:hypothetical protein [bacterium]